MAKNEKASNGIIEELVRAMIQVGCCEIHTKTLIEKYEAQLSNGTIDIDDEDVVIEKNNQIEREDKKLKSYAYYRRKIMNEILDIGEEISKKKGNHDLWCKVKHGGLAMMFVFESYQASNEKHEINLYDIWLGLNQLFIGELSEFIGLEWTDCASCFGDMVQGLE